MSQKKQSIWIVFSGKTDLRWLCFLKRGFRHCYALIHDGNRWMSIDPLASHTDIEVYHQISPDYDLPSWLEYQGDHVLFIEKNKAVKKMAPPAIFTCVEMMKRLIGLHQPFILTPWQLYQFLKNNYKEKKYG